MFTLICNWPKDIIIKNPIKGFFFFLWSVSVFSLCGCLSRGYRFDLYHEVSVPFHLLIWAAPCKTLIWQSRGVWALQVKKPSNIFLGAADVHILVLIGPHDGNPHRSAFEQTDRGHSWLKEKPVNCSIVWLQALHLCILSCLWQHCIIDS